MKIKRYVAVDIGAASGRVVVGWIERGRLYTEEIHRFITGDIFLVDRKIRDIYRWLYEIRSALKLYGKRYHDVPAAIGVDAMGSDFVLTDRAGNILRMPLSYRDSGFDDDIQDFVEKQYGAWNIYKITGNQSMPSDTLHQLIRLVRTEDFSIERADGILFLGDAMHYLLCGCRSVEHSLAGYGRLFHQREHDWEDSIFRAFHIPTAIKSRVVYCGDMLGTVHRQICTDAGFAEDISVITPCTHDTSCAALSVPDEGDDWIFISSGSWSLMGMETREPIITEEGWRFNISNSSMPFRTNMFKKIITGMWIIQQCQKAWGDIEMEKIVRLAEKSGKNNIYIYPDDNAFYAPEHMPQAISQNITGNYGVNISGGDVGRIANIFFESLALQYRYCAEKLMEISKRKIRKLYIVGGGSKNTLVNQYVANAAKLPVLTGVTEASATGNLLCQMYGNKEVGSKSEIKEILKNTYPVKCYVPQNTEEWEEKFQEYKKKFLE